MSKFTFTWGLEFLESEDGDCGWVCRDEGITRGQAKQIAAKEWGCDFTELRCQAVLMREESEVEAEINGHEFACVVECTKRARNATGFWRLWRASEPPLFVQRQQGVIS